MLGEAVLLLLSLVCFYFVLRKPQNLPPGVWGLPVLGKIPSSSERLGDQVKALRPRYGDIITWRIGGRVFVFLCNQSIIKRALAKQELSDRPAFATNTAFCQKDMRGVIFSNGLKWQIQRRFAIREMRNLGMGKTKVEQAIQEEAAFLVQDFKKHTGKDDPLPMSFGVAVLNTIWKVLADTRFEVDDPRAHDIVRLVGEMNESFEGPVTLFNYFPWLERFGPDWVRKKLGLEKLSRLAGQVKKIVQVAVSEHEKTFDPLHQRDLIDEYLLAMKKESEQYSVFSLEELSHVAVDLFAAGIDTTTTMLRWCILYLAKYPEVQRRVHREVDDVLPRGITPSYQDRTKLPYFQAVLNELHRIVSLTPLAVPHVASQDTQIDGYSIPKGTVLISHLECCHKDPDLWERPDQFYPERFLDASGKLVNREGLMPFGSGRRACLGEPLARVELVIFLLTLIQNFFFTAPKGEPLSTENDPKEFILNTPKPFRITITERQN